MFALPSIRCSGIASTYFARFQLHVSSCLGITAIFVALLFYAYSKDNIARGKPVKTSTVWNTFLPFLFLIYPSISKTVILMLRCRTINGVRYLLSDISVSCESAEYAKYWYFAVFGVFAFPIGIVVFFTALVGMKRDRLPPDWWPGQEKEMEANNYEVYCSQCSASDSTSDWQPLLDNAGNMYYWSETMQQSSWIDPSAAGTDGAPAKPFEEWIDEIWTPQMEKYDKIFKRVGFLTSTYTKQYWWFESLVTVYKLAMTVLVMFVSDGDENKILCGMLGATAMMAFYSFYQPFRHRDILSINTGAQLVVLTVLFAAMFLLLNGGGGTFFALALVCLTLTPLVAGVVLTLRLPQEAIVRSADDVISDAAAAAVMAKLSSGKLGKIAASLGKLVSRKKRGQQPGQPAGSADSPWDEHKDQEGRTYFLNAQTGVSSWERPTVSASANEALPLRALRAAASGVHSMLCGALRMLRSAASRIRSVLCYPFSRSAAEGAKWTEHKTAEGRTFFQNEKTGNTSWERPAESTAAAGAPAPLPLRALRAAASKVRSVLCGTSDSTPEPAKSPDEWTEQVDEDGNVYFYNAKTAESAWELPSAPPAVAPPPRLNALQSVARSLRSLVKNPSASSREGWIKASKKQSSQRFGLQNPMHKAAAAATMAHEGRKPPRPSVLVVTGAHGLPRVNSFI